VSTVADTTARNYNRAMAWSRAWILLLASCQGTGVATETARPSSGSAEAMVVAPAPPPKPATIPGMQFDRPGKPLGLGTRYEIEGVHVMTYCPGDQTIVAVGKDKVFWVGADHGRAVRELDVAGASGASSVDCRADGAVVLVTEGAAVLIERDGAPKRSEADPEVTHARFAADGSVRVLRGTKYGKWSGDAIEDLFDTGTPAWVVEGGALLHVHDKFLWLKRDGKETRIDAYSDDSYGPGSKGVAELSNPMLVSDGTLAAMVAGMLKPDSVAWVRGKRVLISGSMGSWHVFATPKWLGFTNSNSVWTMSRPGLQYAHRDYACPSQDLDEGDQLPDIHVAPSHDGTRLAIDCGDVNGIRILSLATLDTIAGRSPQPLVALASHGDQLATRDHEGLVQIWRDGKLQTSIDPGYQGSTLFWLGGDIVVEDMKGQWRWSVATGKRGKQVAQSIGVTARAKELALHTTFEPEGFAIQRGEAFTLVPFANDKSIARIAISPDGKRGLALRESDNRGNDLVVIDPSAFSTRLLSIPADAIAVSDTETVISRKRDLARLVDDKPVALATAQNDITALAYSPDGRALAVGRVDGKIEIYAGATRVTTLVGHRRKIRVLLWDTPELVSSADDQTLIWTFTP
jgi:WD40 repeat protein